MSVEGKQRWGKVGNEDAAQTIGCQQILCETGMF